MLKKSFVLIGFIAIASLAIIGCEGERGVQGEPGTATCFGCHDNDNLEMIAIEEQWRNSVHGSTANTERAEAPCSRCHTGEGFLNMIGDEDTVAVAYPSSIHCFVCHAPHTNGNFNLRTTEPPVLEMGGTFDHGPANLCANCHQARQPNPALTDADSISITSSRWGPHHGVQGDVFMGLHAYEFTGAYDSNHPHNAEGSAACIACHMAEPFGNEAGGHTWRMTYIYHEVQEDFVTGCNIEACHNGDLEDFHYEGVQDSVESKLTTLRTLLVGAGYLNATTGLVNASSSSPLRISMDDAGAIFNFFLFEEDRSNGVHNPDYVLEALDASIAQMSSRALAQR